MSDKGTFADGSPYDEDEAFRRRLETMSRTQKMSLLGRQLLNASEGAVNCATCELRKPTWTMYRCFYCGLFFCEHCCPDHFGMTREEYQEARADEQARESLTEPRERDHGDS